MKRIAISAFLLFHIIAITCWCIPLDSPLVREIRDVVRPYMFWSGLFQSWDPFAPSPKSVNIYVEAVVIFEDGRTRTFKFPRMEQLSLAQRYYKERYRKFAENFAQDSYSALWPDVARYVARMNKNNSNPPEIVMLIRYWSDIAPQADGSYHPGPERARIFFRYDVKPEDLK